MKMKAYAKINLSLDVTGVRADGYHLLKMVMQSIDLYDEISVELIAQGIELTCNRSFIPLTQKNIAYKAVLAFMKRTGIKSGARIHLEKQIPVAGGLAGGSTDAGAVLKLLNELTGRPLSFEQLLEVGLGLGADVPFTMTGGTALCEGVGEIITPLPDFSGHTILLVKPSFGVSTRQVFSDFKIQRVRNHPATNQMVSAIRANDVQGVASHLSNVLENVTLRRRPQVRKIKEALINQGAIGSLMSGSGPTVFGIFDEEEKAKNAYAVFKAQYSETFLTKTRGKV